MIKGTDGLLERLVQNVTGVDARRVGGDKERFVSYARIHNTPQLANEIDEIRPISESNFDVDAIENCSSDKKIKKMTRIN